MSYQFAGDPALVANNLPTAKTVTNATNATPIVVTTSGNHGLQTRDVFTISGVAGNTAANGTFVAGTVTLTTVTLLAYPGATNVAGTGAWTSGGTLQALGFGVTYPNPNDATDGMRAAMVNVALEALGDRTAYLMMRAGPSGDLESNKVDRAGDTMTGSLHMAQATSIVADGTGATLAGDWNTPSGAVFTCSSGGSWVVASGGALSVSYGGTATFGSCPLLGAGSAVAITDATNATPIVVTAAGHNLVDGQQVAVASVGGNTNANGTWVVNVLTGSTFELVGSAGNAGYTAATGTVTPAAQVKHSTARTVTRLMSSLWTDGNQLTDSGWGAQPSTGAFVCFVADPTIDPQQFGYEIDVPQGSTLTAAAIYMQPNSGHSAFPGGAPATFPQVDVYRFTAATGVTTLLATGTDPHTGSVGVYEVYTPIVATLGTPEIIDRQRCRYYFVLSTETGANAMDGTRVFAGSCTYTIQFAEQF